MYKFQCNVTILNFLTCANKFVHDRKTHFLKIIKHDASLDKYNFFRIISMYKTHDLCFLQRTS